MNTRKFNGICTRSVDFQMTDNADGGDGRTLSGYAAVFNSETEINSHEGRFTETIAPGAFKKTLRERPNIIMQYEHGRDIRVGSTPIGCYKRLEEDGQGLFVEGRLFDNPVVEPIRQAIEGGAISGMSFKFQVVRDEWRDSSGKLIKGDEIYRLLYEPGDRGPIKRTIREVKCYEAGPVSTPAYEQTSIGVRSASEMSDEERRAVADSYRATMAEITGRDESEVPELKWPNPIDEGSQSVARETHSVAVPVAADEDRESHEEHANRADETPDGGLDIETHGGSSILDSTLEYIKETYGRTEEPESEDRTETGDGATDIAEETNSEEARAVESDTPAPESPEGNAVPSSEEREDTLLREQKKETSRKAPVIVRKKAMTLAELRVRLAELEQRREEIEDEFEGRSIDDATVEAEYEGIEVEEARVKKSIAGIERRMAAVAERATNPDVVERGSDRGPAVHIKPSNIYDLDALRSSCSVDELPNRLRDNAMRAVEEGRFSKIVARETAQESVQALLDGSEDEDSTLAKRILRTGSPLYERAWSKMVATSNPMTLTGEEARALSLGTDTAGGFAVPYQLDPTVILTSAGVIDPLRSISRVERITGKEWQGITSAGVTVSRDAEAEEVSDDSFALNDEVVRTKRVQGFVPFSYELAESWPTLRSEITRQLLDAKTREEATSFMLGDGTGNNANGLIGTLTANTVNAASGQAFTAANVYALEEALDPRYRTNAAKFIGHKAIYNKVRQFDTGGGAQLWERIGAGQPSELLGYQALESSVMASVHTTGSKFLLFGNFENFLIVDRIGMSVELIPQVFGANRRPTGQRGVYAVWMNNSKILVDAAFKVLIGIA